MKLLNEFIFDKEADAKEFIDEISELYYKKGYLSYGDVCKKYYGDDVDYNHYDIYNNHGWISIYIFEVKPAFDDKFKVEFPEIMKIKQKLNIYKGE